MKRRVFLSMFMVMTVTLVALTSGCGEDQSSITTPEITAVERPDTGGTVELQGYGSSWPYYSQSYRNQLLLNVGYGDMGRYGGECKVWVQDLVRRVTDGRVIVPTNVCNTCPSRYLWNPDPYGHVRGQSMDIRYVQPGQVVQMKWDGYIYPHTFIMGGKSSSGFYMLDANWNKDGRVRYHYMSYSQFRGMAGLRYTVYTIGW